MQNRVGEIMRLILDATPVERAEVLNFMRGKMVETQHGLMAKEDFEKVIVEAKDLNHAAHKLGVCRRTLQYHMRLLGIPPGGKRMLSSSS
jgi:hypothetical protein